MENKYEKAQIYLIKAPNCDKGYVGSTIQGLKIRLSKHETDYRGYLGINPKERNYRGSFEILCEQNYDIHLLENYPCENKKELEKREAMWITKLSATLEMTNKNMPSTLTISDITKMSELSIPDKLLSLEISNEELLENINNLEDPEFIYD
jgi:hypothetical protein